MDKQKDIVGENLLEKEEVEQTGQTPPGPAVSQPMMPPPASTDGHGWRFDFLRSRKFIVAVVVVLMIFLLAVTPIFFVVQAATRLQQSIKTVSTGIKAQNLNQVKGDLGKVKQNIGSFDRSLTPLVWMKFIPGLGGYWEDAKNGARGGIAAVEATELLIPAIEPYSDLLGFNGATPPAGEPVEPGGEGAKTAEERIDFLVASLPNVTPKLDPVGEKLVIADQALRAIDANRYPTNIKGKNLRKGIADMQTLVGSVKTLIVDGKPLLEVSPYLLGMNEERTYLVIFQNDKELRPTGGFMTGYSLMKVKEGKIQPVSSDDIYNLDKRYKANIEAPKPFREHIKQPYSQNPNWRLRDMNWSPDFKTSMDLILTEAKKAKLPKVDGVIGVDTNILVALLQVTGRIGVPGQGNFSADKDDRCDCPQVIYELESYADVEKPIVWDPNTGKIVFGEIVDNRKAILGPLVNSVIANSLAQPKEKVPELAQAVISNLQEKHVVFYMFDEKVQKALEAFNVAGRVKEAAGEDYLAIVDANLGGRKSNLYVTHEVNDKVTIQADKIIHDMTITYKNPQSHDGWLNSVLPNYMRVYVPQGAKLLSATGTNGDIETTEDIGKTVFAGFFELRPEGVVKVSLKYELPKHGDHYQILVQKQVGKPAFHYTISVGRKTEEFQLVTDKELRFD